MFGCEDMRSPRDRLYWLFLLFPIAIVHILRETLDRRRLGC